MKVYTPVNHDQADDFHLKSQARLSTEPLPRGRADGGRGRLYGQRRGALPKGRGGGGGGGVRATICKVAEGGKGQGEGRIIGLNKNK